MVLWTQSPQHHRDNRDVLGTLGRRSATGLHTSPSPLRVLSGPRQCRPDPAGGLLGLLRLWGCGCLGWSADRSVLPGPRAQASSERASLCTPSRSQAQADGCPCCSMTGGKERNSQVPGCGSSWPSCVGRCEHTWVCPSLDPQTSAGPSSWNFGKVSK